MNDFVKLVEIWRGDYLECVHNGAAVVVDDTGAVVESWGNPDQIILPRSSLKPVQAFPLVASGAAEKYRLTSKQLAMSCASHNGAGIHTDIARDWLKSLDLGDDDLRCGPQWPSDRSAANELVKSDESPCQIHNNCSGKHCGFLTLSKHVGGGAEYVDPNHPVQIAAKQATEDLCGEDVLGHAVDGCSAPNFAVSLAGLARGLVKLHDHVLIDAMMQHPGLVAGEGRACTNIMRALPGKAAVKTGAEGVFVAVLPEQKLGIALKIQDGATRASECALSALLVRLGIADANDPAIKAYLNPTQLNRAKLETGEIRAATTLLS